MFSPISRTAPAWVAALALAACARGDDPVATAAVADRIECAVAGAAFAKACVVEAVAGGLILRHADGGFRRIAVAADGTLSAADGSVAARGTTLPDGRFEVMLAGDRYRLPKRR